MKKLLLSIMLIFLVIAPLSAQQAPGVTVNKDTVDKTADKKAEVKSVLSAEEKKLLGQLSERITQLAPEVDKAAAAYQAVRGSFDAALSQRMALFYKVCAEKKLDPSKYTFNQDGTDVVPVEEKK